MPNKSRDKPGSSMHALLSELWPLHRTVNSDDIEVALDMCRDYLGDDAHYVQHRFKPKMDVHTWWIPERFKVNQAWLEVDGVRIKDRPAARSGTLALPGG